MASNTADAIRAAATSQLPKQDDPVKEISLEETNANLKAQLALAMEKIAELAPQPVLSAGLRRYYSRAPFCNFHVMRSQGYCTQHQFIAGAFETDDPAIQEFLDLAAKQQDPAISHENVFGHVRQEEVLMHADLAAAASKAHGRMVASGLSTS